MDWNFIVNNPESEVDAEERGRLLIENMVVGNDWKVFVWKLRDYHYEIRSKKLGIVVYPTTHSRNGTPRFAVNFSGVGSLANSAGYLNWEDCDDPNKAVLDLIESLRNGVAAEVKFLDEVVSAV
jgi:hypothetical protein